LLPFHLNPFPLQPSRRHCQQQLEADGRQTAAAASYIMLQHAVAPPPGWAHAAAPQQLVGWGTTCAPTLQQATRTCVGARVQTARVQEQQQQQRQLLYVTPTATVSGSLTPQHDPAAPTGQSCWDNGLPGGHMGAACMNGLQRPSAAGGAGMNNMSAICSAHCAVSMSVLQGACSKVAVAVIAANG
jgi:hypothetical protein